jgi:hypothetical protein
MPTAKDSISACADYSLIRGNGMSRTAIVLTLACLPALGSMSGSALGAAAQASAASTAEVRTVLEAQQSTQAAGASSQQRIEVLDDETLAMISEYNGELSRLQDLETYNDNMRQLLASQAVEKARLEGELQEIEVIRQSIVPLMVEMVGVLDQFISLDLPMLEEERAARVAELENNLTRSDVEIAEKYRRVIEAYQIEADYGQTIEAYEGTLAVADSELTVDFLRVGRVALYYLSLDRENGGLWNPRTAGWHMLDEGQLDALDFAVRVARKQAPPNLIELPLWTWEAP